MDAPKFEEDHHPEVVESGKASRRIERLGLKEELGDPEKRRAYFGNLTDEKYKKALGYVNSLSRGESIDYNYQDGQLPLEPTPQLEDKERLMSSTFQTVREILGDENMNTAHALRVAGLTLAGGVNYIHPYENGNGRTGRVMHYVMEFGNQRGEQVLEEELYAIIGKLPLYDTDRAKALDDGPPPELTEELNQLVGRNSEGITDLRVLASKRVELFLAMMKGNVDVPINREVIIRNLSLAQVGDTIQPEKVSPGQINGRELYEKQYLYNSSVPNRRLGEVPLGARRVMGERQSLLIPRIMLNVDLV